MTDDRLHLIVHLGTDRVAFPAGFAGGDLYLVHVETSWITATAVTEKNGSGCTIRFGTPAPAGATIRYSIAPM